MVNSIFLSILFALFLVLLIILMAKLSKDNIKYLDYVLVLYVIILILYLGLCFWAISKGINYWYVQLIRNLVGLFFYIYFWSLFILLNGLNNRDIHLIPVSSRVEMTIIILLYTFLTILLTISSISLLLFPNEVDFIMVILLVSILSGWINKTFSDIRLMYLFIPTTLLIYIFILAIISIIIRFNLYYQKYELLIFLSISFYFISQTIFDNDYIELYGKKISIILDKNFLRLILLTLTSVSAFYNKSFDIFNSINSAILVSIAFDSFYKGIKKNNAHKFDEDFINAFINNHNLALKEITDTSDGYIEFMAQKYNKIKIIDIGYIDEAILDFIIDKYNEYIPILPFCVYCTLGTINNARKKNNQSLDN